MAICRDEEGKRDEKYDCRQNSDRSDTLMCDYKAVVSVPRGYAVLFEVMIGNELSE